MTTMRNPRMRDADGTEYDPETGERRGALPPYPAEAMREMIEYYEQMVREVTGISLETDTALKSVLNDDDVDAGHG